jgi:multidrug efflux system membrane fusion protein
LGPGDPTNVSIAQGLAPGEVVVVDGADKLKDGAKIQLRQNTASATPGTGQAQHPGQGQGKSGSRRQPRNATGGG